MSSAPCWQAEQDRGAVASPADTHSSSTLPGLGSAPGHLISSIVTAGLSHDCPLHFVLSRCPRPSTVWAHQSPLQSGLTSHNHLSPLIIHTPLAFTIDKLVPLSQSLLTRFVIHRSPPFNRQIVFFLSKYKLTAQINTFDIFFDSQRLSNSIV